MTKEEQIKELSRIAALRAENSALRAKVADLQKAVDLLTPLAANNTGEDIVDGIWDQLD